MPYRSWLDDHPGEVAAQTVPAPCCGRPVAPDMLHAVAVLPAAARAAVPQRGREKHRRALQEREEAAAAVLQRQPTEIPPPAAYVCDACRERLFRENVIDRVAYALAHGLSGAEVARLRQKLAGNPFAIGDPAHPRGNPVRARPGSG